MSKLLFLDTETTGVDERYNALIQIAGIIEINGEVKETFTVTAKPYDSDKISEESLKVTGLTVETISGYNKPEDTYKYIITLFSKYIDKYNRNDKFQMIGWNSTFDDRFLRAFFRKNSDKYYGSFISWPALDLSTLAVFFLLHKRHELLDFKQATVARYLGIEVDTTKTHDALYDIELARKIYQELNSKRGEI